jgi:hypothetical protein
MKKAKKAKTPTGKTALDRIAAQLRTVLRRETTDVILIGNLLIESRKHLEHGEWQDWLAENFDLSYRTAVNYCDAAEYVERKSETVADFANLAQGVLYWLAAGYYNATEEAAILAATREHRVDQTRAGDICEALRPPDPEPDDLDDADEAVEAAEAAEDAEIAAILEGPPPDVPPPAPNTTPDYTLHQFDQAVSALKQLMTKPAARFASTAHTTGDLRGVETFIHAVADRLRETSDESPIPITESAR